MCFFAKRGRTGVRVTVDCIADHKHKDLQDHECADFVLLIWLQIVTQTLV